MRRSAVHRSSVTPTGEFCGDDRISPNVRTFRRSDSVPDGIAPCASVRTDVTSRGGYAYLAEHPAEGAPLADPIPKPRRRRLARDHRPRRLPAPSRVPAPGSWSCRGGSPHPRAASPASTRIPRPPPPRTGPMPARLATHRAGSKGSRRRSHRSPSTRKRRPGRAPRATTTSTSSGPTNPTRPGTRKTSGRSRGRSRSEARSASPVRSVSRISSDPMRSRNASTGCAASRRGRW